MIFACQFTAQSNAAVIISTNKHATRSRLYMCPTSTQRILAPYLFDASGATGDKVPLQAMVLAADTQIKAILSPPAQIGTEARVMSAFRRQVLITQVVQWEAPGFLSGRLEANMCTQLQQLGKESNKRGKVTSDK